ncbi:F0F1 ATP synthase subunit delta [Horticoccus sp. 23ND18S-11]|uniref:F0F1 ATP synthase subunit delta n=1 Tax=Horticoccus sp. 23ND18S-11 TaxID=3391832 RepID=UPI0039C8E85B
MASGNKQIQQLARQLFKLSFVGGSLSAESVSGVLQYVEKHRPPHTLAVLKIYQRLVSAEVARGQAVVEHAGPVNDALLATIATAMTRKYARPVTSQSRRNDALIAGLRVRVGDDVYESSVSGQLAALASAV